MFSFRILSIPPGIETDEGSIALNAALISQNLRDQNNRFMPVFILSSDRTDWKQPVMIYEGAVLFRLLGKSLLVFKLINILTMTAVVGVTGMLAWLLFGRRLLTTICMLLMATTPMVIITARLGNESAQPALFSSLWLLWIYLFWAKKKNIYLILAAFSLGIGMYAFKGMRVLVPVWTIISGMYIYILSLEGNKHLSLLRNKVLGWKETRVEFARLLKSSVLNRKFMASILIFGFSILPFVVIMPFLESKYAGAVFDRKVIGLMSYRHYAHYWLSNLSFSFWFTKSDVGKIYQTEQYGAVLLANLPLFLLGIKNVFKKKGFFLFILAAYLSTPVLFGVAGSVDYSHRLVGMIPMLTILVTGGVDLFLDYFKDIKKKSAWFNLWSKTGGVLLVVFWMVNFANFCSYYYFEYPKLSETKTAFGNNLNRAFENLARESKKTGYTPFIQEDVFSKAGDGNRFYEIAYFDGNLGKWKLGEELPGGTILLTQNSTMEGFSKSKADVAPLYLLVKELKQAEK